MTGSAQFTGDVNIHSISDLYPTRRFVVWKWEVVGERRTKVPYSPKTHKKARTNDPTTWATYEHAACYAKEIGGEIGIVLGDLGNGYFLYGIDLDSCIGDDGVADWALDVFFMFSTYGEISPSGKGIKLYLLVSSADHALLGLKTRISFNKGNHCEIALDRTNRYYALTEIRFDEGLIARPLSVANIGKLRRLIDVIGPEFMGHESGQSGEPAGETQGGSKSRDKSGSAALFRLAIRTKYQLRSKEYFVAAAANDEGAAAHLAKLDEKGAQRAIDRAWERAPAPPEPTYAELFDKFIGGSVADPITARLNERFALVRHAGRTLVVEFKQDGIQLGSVEDLHKWHANDLVPKRGKKEGCEPASRYWISDPHRREYAGIEFDPGGNAPSNVLNLWSGFAVEPDFDAGCERIISHIREVIAAGNTRQAEYLLMYLADIVQNIGRKPGVALVFKGPKGAGKDTLAVLLTRILGGRHVAHITRPDALTERFNAPFATAILVHVEEAYWSGARDKKGTLQALITSESLTIERKGIDRMEVASCLRVMMTTNEEWAIPASHDERRYAVFDVSDNRVGDHAYFRQLYEEIEGEGAAAFLAYLMQLDLSDFNIRDVPQTSALRDQKINSLEGVQRWWFEILFLGALPLDTDANWNSSSAEVAAARLRANYEQFMLENRFQGAAVNSSQFGKELRKLVPTLSVRRPRVNGKPGERYWSFPPLFECRKAMATFLNAEIEWEEATEDR
jgi:hypothetical protein